ncbi:MAG: pyridoxal phosphate-dependent aminotransferase [Bacteroidales bacterium]|jgi:aspartate/methionine/tyrosine aminotransferase|nr:pyridoxal phosphate-dependent aminotransferase [Bacteroidales bacterium]
MNNNINNNKVPFDRLLVDGIITKNNIKNVGAASIREVKKIIDDVEASTGERFVRMEMGIPGLEASKIGVEAEIEALKNGVAAIYPDIYGTAMLKKETAKFVKNFLDITVSEDCCVPTVGSMQAGFAAFMTISRLSDTKNKILFIDPGFPVQKQQCKILGIETESFDVYDYRGEKLRAKLEQHLSKGDIAALIYSSPNNPAWFCFNEMELKIIAEVANRYDVIVIEDLAYFAMDFRKDYGKPGVAPFQPSVGKWANKFIIMISGSKAFSYAGQRIAVMIISPKLFDFHTDYMNKYFTQDTFGRAIIFGSLYALTSGTAHSPQYALAAIFKACNEGQYNFVEDLKEYEKKAHFMKNALREYGFKIVYDKDLDVDIADGFYFTFGYPGFTGEELLSELVYYGISAISLSITGSKRTEGVRACVSLVPMDMLPEFAARLKQFQIDHPVK